MTLERAARTRSPFDVSIVIETELTRAIVHFLSLFCLLGYPFCFIRCPLMVVFVVICVVPNPAGRRVPFSAPAVLSNTKHLIEERLVDPLSVPNLLVCERSPRLPSRRARISRRVPVIHRAAAASSAGIATRLFELAPDASCEASSSPPWTPSAPAVVSCDSVSLSIHP